MMGQYILRSFARFGTILYNLENEKNTHGRALPLKSKSKTPP